MTHWNDWPKWTGDEVFRTPRFQFTCSVKDYSLKTNQNEIALLKNREFLELYRDRVFTDPVRKIFELGFFQGGMPLFLADMVAPEKIVAIDWYAPSQELLDLIKANELESSVKLFGNIDQGDTKKIRSILDESFGDEPVDLMIDDCSHFYAQTKASFQAAFGYLKPGGKYIIEDWGWTHWPGHPWQSPESPFGESSSMSNLIFELIMALASASGVVAGVDVVNPACVIVTRGAGLAHKEPLDLARITNVAGNRRARLIEAAEAPPPPPGLLSRLRAKLG